MTSGDREIDFTTLHPPELDLMGNEAAAAHPLRVRASYVARLDERLRRAGPVDLEDQLWPEAPGSLFSGGSESGTLSGTLGPVGSAVDLLFRSAEQQKVQPGIVPQGGHGPPAGQSLAT